jgi:hypothetical protein
VFLKKKDKDKKKTKKESSKKKKNAEIKREEIELIAERQKTKKPKKEKEESSLQSVIEALLAKQLEDKTLELQLKTLESFDEAFIMGAYSFDLENGLDYGVLFSYLNGESKENPYMNYFEMKRKEKEEKEEKDRQAKELSYEKIVKFVKSGRVKEITGVNAYEATPFLKEKYEYFKIFNQAYSFLLYQMIR